MAPELKPAAAHGLPSRTELAGWAEALGFQAIGISHVHVDDQADHVHRFLAQGFNGEMGYLARNLKKRLHPPSLIPGTVCVITARMNYLPAETQPLEILNSSDKAYISRYALGRDYHKVLRKRLARLAEQIQAACPNDYDYRAFTDSAPVLEKALAAQSGLGWIGKHTLVLDKVAGSWFFLGEIYTNAPFTADPTPDIAADACGKCNACITVCPTDAILAPRQLDARRCISYLTIESKNAIPEDLRELMGNRVFGCDDCQLFCPWNREAPVTEEADFSPRHGLQNASLLALFLLDEQEFLALTEGSAMRRISYTQFQRNLAVGLGNGPATADVLVALRERLATAEPMVAEHIQWALRKLGG